MAQHLVSDRAVVLHLAGDGKALARSSAGRHGLVRVGGLGQPFPQRRRHLSVGHRSDPNRGRGRQRAAAGGRSVGLEEEGHNVRVGLLAQASLIRGRHGGLDVAHEIGGGARSPGIHEVAASQRRSLIAAAEVREMAARAVGLIRREALGRLGRSISRRGLALAGDRHEAGGGDDGREAHSKERHFSRAFYRTSLLSKTGQTCGKARLKTDGLHRHSLPVQVEVWDLECRRLSKSQQRQG